MLKKLKAIVPILFASSGSLADESAFLRCRDAAEPAARLACYDAVHPSTRPAEQFGLKERAPASRPETIESYIPGVFDGWGPKTRLQLANGQVWQVSDGSSGSYRLLNPKIRIRRGALGTYFLEIEGENRSPRVRRIE